MAGAHPLASRRYSEIQFVTVTSSVGGGSADAFENFFPRPLQFDSQSVEVALYALHYNLPHGGSPAKSYVVYSDAVVGTEIFGDKFVNALHSVALLDEGEGEWTPNAPVLMWKPCSGGSSIASVAIKIADTSGNDAVDLTGTTQAVLAFRAVEK